MAWISVRYLVGLSPSVRRLWVHMFLPLATCKMSTLLKENWIDSMGEVSSRKQSLLKPVLWQISFFITPKRFVLDK